ncbi:hypothetical protein GE118_00915 [Mycoplasma sp. NEAQ87857]|uniref:aquaporin n=1 Tax=Mycoplasma sp. NEAQ87857 TaxID=2683967 RepID=UPI001318284B|nr:aquaporin [Mycoplasma sp. NEAQ87857]QGZ97363.1 hypothetical protein GE118_00915 [Mycoplasma sp. NEAQ87857]
MDKTKQQGAAKDFWTFFKSFFSFYKLTKERRENAQKPKDLRTWLIHGVSEYIGTILLSLALAGLSIYVGKEVIEEYLLHPIIVGFYAGFVAVGLVLFIFLRWSCDLNPSVSLFRYLNGTNNGYYTIYKIVIQFLGGITAGFIIYGIGHATSGVGIENSPIDALGAAKKAFSTTTNHSSLTAGVAWIVFVELVMTGVLLFPIFSPNINNKYRDLFIMFIISMSVWMGLLGGTAAINPARGLAQQIPALVFHNSGGHAFNAIASANPDLGFGIPGDSLTKYANEEYFKGVVLGTAAMLIADLLAPVFYIFVQGLTQNLVNPLVVKIINYKNYKSQNMTTSKND